MKKIILNPIFIFALTLPLHSQWVHTYDGGDADFATAITVDIDRSIFVTGWSVRTDLHTHTKQIVTIKYNSSGTQLWVARYDDPDGSDSSVAIAVSDSGFVYVTGKSYVSNGNGYDYITIKYDSTGNEKWHATYNGSGSKSDYSYAIAVNDSGHVFVTGWSDRNTSSLDEEWDFVTIKYTAGGVEKWVNVYNYYISNLDRGYDIALDDSSNVYVTGSSYADGDTVTSATTIKYNTGGAQQWVKRYDSPGETIYDGCRHIVLDDLANVYVAGMKGPGAETTDMDFLTIKYTRGGSQQWVSTYDRANDFDCINGIAVDGSYNVFVTGRCDSTGGYSGSNYVTIGYNSSGAQQWVAQYEGGSADVPTGIKVGSCSDDIFITGFSSQGAQGYDYVYIRYDNSGNEIWVRNFDGGNTHDSSSSIAIFQSPLIPTHIYLAGGSNLDFGTVDDTTYQSCLDSPFGKPLSVKTKIPFKYNLSQNYPNPFNPQTDINFEIQFGSPVSLTVYDITGKEVMKLLNNEYRQAGRYSVQFNGNNLASGIYFYRIEAGSFSDSKKMLLIK